jgi:hypothetical protein
MRRDPPSAFGTRPNGEHVTMLATGEIVTRSRAKSFRSLLEMTARFARDGSRFLAWWGSIALEIPMLAPNLIMPVIRYCRSPG